ncbi:LacI family transcriptional regulator [Actinoplanes sp. ATCC 53533]|uniref:LacI family DNA-binding transcriptional regulator n=1 Tax=Actinoplanes sp. ATCC 53533 TaxID=1288362 RepID=UPI000F7691C7|nr:LacI family DNA-binding transcriptional regulator [Actinoplanes sp. ATCC 53533]RSM45376.1 LacI family transcriptional regulator [Actinoplanes sp. ATCC 53533]
MSESSARQAYKHGLLTSIAREAGVSVATVSKVVHGKPDVGPATRQRIEALLEEYGAGRETPEAAPARRIYAVFRDLDSPYTLEVVRGVVDAGSQAGFEVVIGTTMHRSIAQWLDACSDPGVLGMILIISMMAEHDQKRVLSKHVPVVLIDPLSQPLPGVPSVGVTDWHGAHDAVGHLLELGHRRIGIIAGRPHSPAGGARLHGYRAALHNAGIEYDTALVRSTDFDYGESVTATTELLTLPERPTAIFATSDAQALGTLEAARALRISVPDDLSVVSFDDTSAAATASPPLTAVRQPYDELGQIATSLLVDMSNGKSPVVDRFELATAFTLRSSTAALVAQR